MFLTEYFAKNKTISTVFLIILLSLGVFSVLQIKRDVVPYTEPETFFVQVVSPGSSAQDIEQNIVKPLENSLQVLEITPQSWVSVDDNNAFLNFTLSGAVNLKEVKQKAIRQIQSVPLPPDTRLFITEQGTGSVPMYYFLLYRENNVDISLVDFQRIAANVQEQASQVKGLSGVIANGLFPEEIQIVANPNLIDKFYISLYEIVQAIQLRNLRLSGGLLDFGDDIKNLVTDGGFSNAMDITNLIVRANFENQKIHIKDIAQVTEGVEKNLFSVEINGSEGIFFGLKMKGGEDIKKTTEVIDAFVQKVQKELPNGIKLDVVERRFTAVNDILSTAISSALIGVIILFFILRLFFDKRTAFWTTMTVPTTIALTFVYMYFSGFSINIISLCAITLVLGMLVDHGIVISENIYFYRLAGLSPLEAMRKGVREVFFPILVTVLTTVAAFLPMISIKSILGEIIRPIPYVVCVALIISFFESVILLPAHLYHVPKKDLPTGDQKWFIKIREFYEKILKTSLKIRYAVLVFFIFLLMIAGVVTMHMAKTFILLEPIGVSTLFVQLEAEKGISFEAMKGLVQEVKSVAERTLPKSDIKAIRATTGDNATWDFTFYNGKANIGQVAVYLQKGSRHFEKILNDLKKGIANSGVTNKFKTVAYDTYNLMPSIKEAVVIRFIQRPEAPDSRDYINAMKESYDYFTNMPGVIKTRHTEIEGNKQLKIVFDYEKAARLGVDVRSVAETLRIAAGGLKVSKWQGNNKEVAYLLKLDIDTNNIIQTLSELPIPNRYMRLIALKEFSHFEEQDGSGEIIRAAGNRMVEMASDVDTSITGPTQVARNFLQYYETQLAQKYPGAQLLSEGESEDIEAYLGDFKIAFIIALMAIYIILLMLFKSIVQPFIVLITIPFGVSGALFAFFLHGQQLSFSSLIGMIGLAGVVVNDAVVMVDFINGVVRSGQKADVVSLIIQGAGKRFKAVVLTTLTTVAGLMPSVYMLKGVADIIVPIATAMAYGMLFATLLTLIFIPCLYLIGFDIKNIFGFFRKEKSSSEHIS